MKQLTGCDLRTRVVIRLRPPGLFDANSSNIATDCLPYLGETKTLF